MRTKKRITDIQTAVDLYFSTDRLSNKDIMKLFDCCEGTAANLKKAAKEQEAQEYCSPALRDFSAQCYPWTRNGRVQRCRRGGRY